MRTTSTLAHRVLLVAVAVPAAVLALGAPVAGAALPDGRVYELVTPTTSPGVHVDALPMARVGGDGNELAFETWGNRNAGPSNTLETYLSTRSPAGWQVKLITPPQAPFPSYNPTYEPNPDPFFAFNGNLSEAVFDTYGSPPVVAGEPPGSNNLYTENPMTGTASASVITTIASGNPYWGPRVADVSSDFNHILFDNDLGGGNYYNVPQYLGPQSVYVWSAGQGMSLASVLPSGKFADQASAGAGALSPLVADATSGSFTNYYGGNPHAISDDGSRIFFTDPTAGYFVVVGHLYERRDQGLPDATTVQLDAPAPGAPIDDTSVYGDYPAHFITATPDGHQVLFSSCQPLTADSTASIQAGTGCRTVNSNTQDAQSANQSSSFANKSDLYIYDEGGNGGAGSLTDITTGDPTGADVLGVVGTSQDLSRVYFVARGNLTGTAPTPNDYCRTPAGQAPNLYVWDRTQGTKFIAQLAVPTDYCFDASPVMDIPVWEDAIDAAHKQAAVTPDGKLLAFATYAALDSTYDNVDTQEQAPHREVYIYKYASGAPVCVSCRNGSGPATADASLANETLTTQDSDTANYPDWQKQNLLPDGSALYFESGDRLSPFDHNATTDVYEYSFATDSDSLISSGQSTEPSNFIGATADGSNVLFSTDQSLLPSDVDNNIDIYDARVGGGVANNPPATGCQSNCAPPPATSTLVGPGNSTKPAVVVKAPPAFALARLTAAQIKAFAASGKVTLTITAPGAGRVSAKALASIGKGPVKTVGSASASARAAGSLRLTLSLSGGARSALRKQGRLAVTIEALFGRSVKTIHVTLTHKR